MKYLKAYRIFENTIIDNIKSEIKDALLPLSDRGYIVDVLFPIESTDDNYRKIRIKIFHYIDHEHDNYNLRDDSEIIIWKDIKDEIIFVIELLFTKYSFYLSLIPKSNPEVVGRIWLDDEKFNIDEIDDDFSFYEIYLWFWNKNGIKI